MIDLTERQQDLVAPWLPHHRRVADLSWPHRQSLVLEYADGDDRVIVEASGDQSNAINREIEAHLRWLGPWRERGAAADLLFHDAGAHLIVTRHLPGTLVKGTPAQDDPEIFRQAGELARVMHAQASLVNHDWFPRLPDQCRAWLDRDHGIDPRSEASLRDILTTWQAVPVTVVPTHSDGHPRNWLVHQGQLRAIDYGNVGLRPAAIDFAALARKDFPRNPALEDAYLAGYGCDPREPGLWHRLVLRRDLQRGLGPWQPRPRLRAGQPRHHRPGTHGVSLTAESSLRFSATGRRVTAPR